jgi:hypothetical protein
LDGRAGNIDREMTIVYSRQPHRPQEDCQEAWRLAWLLCQLNTIDRSHVTIAIGGQQEGAANILLLLAERRQKPLIPIPFLGGAASQSFYRCRYELIDRLDEGIDAHRSTACKRFRLLSDTIP